MGFFGRRDPDAESGESMEWIERGGIPPDAEARLRGLGAAGSLFTSGLSVNEFALLRRLGPQPLAQVLGASAVRPGWQSLPALDPGVNTVHNYQWRTTVVCELDVLTDAWNLARRRAFDRLTEEALQVGADAVVGVHLHRGEHDLGRGTIEYVVTGTAIRLPGSSGTSWPVLTDVSVQDYWRLRSAGHEPVGLLATTAVVFASPSRSIRVQRTRTTKRNQELEELSRGFHSARDTARAKLLGQVSSAHGVGAVGVEFAHSVERDTLPVASMLQPGLQLGWPLGRWRVRYRVSGQSDFDRKGWVITVHAAGTAIRPTRQPSGGAQAKTAIRMRAR